MAERQRFMWPMTLIFLFWIVNISDAYETIYLEDYCATDDIVTINMGSVNSNSSGILKLSRAGRLRYIEDKNCTIILQPPLGFGIVLSIRYLNLDPKDYIEVMDKTKPVRLFGYSKDETEYQSYSSEEAPLKLNYVAGSNKTEKMSTSEIIFIATSYVKSVTYACDLKMFRCGNSRCIWNGLTCDGHNNCGDQSDELSDYPASCGMLTGGTIAGIVVAAVLTFLLCIISSVACCRVMRNKRTRNCEDAPALIQQGSNYNSTSVGNIQSGQSSLAVNGNLGSNSLYDGYQDAPPPAYKP